ncbi:hypothetical protein A9G41_00070 [Gilliamella sp. Nev5-1]|nr:hypothetical protein A9G41_00070 [Gilliamella apicola]
MICNTIMSKLGFECNPITDNISYISSPFTYVDDGEVIGAFVQCMTNNTFRITDNANAILNMETKGINITNSRFNFLKSILHREGVTLSEQAEIVCHANESNLVEAIQKVIRGGIITTTCGVDWYTSYRDKFEDFIINKIKKCNLPQKVLIRKKIIGLSGHEITVPVTLLGENNNKILFTSNAKNDGSWQDAYSVLGKLMDITTFQNNIDINSKIVVVNSDSIKEKLSQLTLLFTEQAQVYPSHLIDKWLPKLAA